MRESMSASRAATRMKEFSRKEERHSAKGGAREESGCAVSVIVEKSNAVVPELVLQKPASGEVALHVVHPVPAPVHDDIGEEPHQLALRPRLDRLESVGVRDEIVVDHVDELSNGVQLAVAAVGRVGRGPNPEPNQERVGRATRTIRIV